MTVLVKRFRAAGGVLEGLFGDILRTLTGDVARKFGFVWFALLALGYAVPKLPF